MISDKNQQVMDQRGIILDIKRFAIHDGPGVRTTVFLKGCPLRCVWCHNPHSQKSRPEVSFQRDLCQYCAQCADICPNDCHEVSPEMHEYRRELCILCGECMAGCLANALSFIGQEQSVAQVIEEVLKDRNYYKTSGGGMTLSGGEPMAQFEFTKALLTAGKSQQLHTVLDTCGYAPYEKYTEILPLVDLLHYDIKETDSKRHEQYTGVGNERIFENLTKINAHGVPIILRCPVIPDFNDREEHFQKLGDLARQCKNVTAIHIMPFHPYGSAHASKLDMPFELESIEAVTEEKAEQWIEQVAAHSPVPVSRG